MKKEEIKNKIGEMKAKAINVKEHTVQFVKDNKDVVGALLIGLAGTVGGVFVTKKLHNSEVVIEDEHEHDSPAENDYYERDMTLDVNGQIISAFMQHLDPDVNCIYLNDEDLSKIEKFEKNVKE